MSRRNWELTGKKLDIQLLRRNGGLFDLKVRMYDTPMIMLQQVYSRSSLRGCHKQVLSCEYYWPKPMEQGFDDRFCTLLLDLSNHGHSFDPVKKLNAVRLRHHAWIVQVVQGCVKPGTLAVLASRDVYARTHR